MPGSEKKRKVISPVRDTEKKAKGDETEKKGKTWKWGILSTGKIAQDFVTAISPMKDLVVVAVGSRTLADAQTFAERFKIAKYYGSYESLVQDPDVDIIYVATPHIFHKDNVELALKHKKHVLCEKPLTVNKKEATFLRDLAQKNNLFLMEALWSRYIPAMVKVREILEKGVLGTVKLVESNFGFKAERSIRRLFEPSLAGGALLDIGVYPVSFTSMVFGPKPPSQILTAGDLTDTKVDEHLSIILKYGPGQLATLNTSLAVNLNNESIITGTNGRLKLHGPMWHCTEKLTLSINGKKDEEFKFPIDSEGREYNFHNSAALRYEAEEVHKCLNQGLTESPIMTTEESINILNTMDTIRKEIGVVYPTEN